MNELLSIKWVKKSLIAIGIITFIAVGVYALSGSNSSANVLADPELAKTQSELGEYSQNNEESGNESAYQNDKESMYILVGLIAVTALVGTFSAFDATRGRKGYKPYYPNSYRKRY